MVENIASYHKIQHLGDAAISDLLLGYVQIEEKVDGSQFRFHIEGDEVTCGSRNMNFGEVGMDKNFAKAVESALSGAKRFGSLGYVDVFCEYLQSPHHNTLTYGKVPKNHLVLFDVLLGGNNWANRDVKEHYANEMEIDCAPLLWNGPGSQVTQELIDELLTKESYLGGQKVEGIVIKNYEKFYNFDKFPFMSGKFLCGKIVRPEFKEANREGWNAKKGSTTQQLIEDLRTDARFAKAVQHLKERNELTNTMRDIKPLIEEVHKDILAEEGERIKEIIWQKVWGEIRGGVAKGIPIWYKEQLAKEALA